MKMTTQKTPTSRKKPIVSSMCTQTTPQSTKCVVVDLTKTNPPNKLTRKAHTPVTKQLLFHSKDNVLE